MGVSSAVLKSGLRTPAPADDPVSGVRPRPVLPEVEGQSDTPSSVLRVRSSLERNNLHAAFRAILELGMRIVKAEVRAVGREAIQTLHVLEADDRAPTESRILEARAALRNVHGPSLTDASKRDPKPRAKRLRSTAPIGEPKWPR